MQIFSRRVNDWRLFEDEYVNIKHKTETEERTLKSAFGQRVIKKQEENQKQ